MSPDEINAEAKALERKYGRRFLELSLHEAAIRWRALTAPNALDQFGTTMRTRAPLCVCCGKPAIGKCEADGQALKPVADRR